MRFLCASNLHLGRRIAGLPEHAGVESDDRCDTGYKETGEDVRRWIKIILGEIRSEVAHRFDLDKLANTGIDWLSMTVDEMTDLIWSTDVADAESAGDPDAA